MPLLDYERLDAIGTEDFLGARPFPHVNPTGLLTDEARRELYSTTPDIGMFRKMFGSPRRYGQNPHDKYVLKYAPGLPVAKIWHQFVEELHGPR